MTEPQNTQTELTSSIETTEAKPGWRTSEFWLKLAAIALTAMFASGVIPVDGVVAKVAAIAATMLGALGYTVARSMVKAGAAMLFVLAIGAPQTGCGASSKSGGKTVLADVVDCTATDRARLETQFGPTVEQALLRALGGDGKVDLPSLDAIGRSLEADGWCVLERAVAQLIASRLPTGALSAAAPLDAGDLRAKVSALRTAKFGTIRFSFEANQQ